MNKKLSGVFTVILMINVLTSNIYAMEHLIDRNDREYSEILSLNDEILDSLNHGPVSYTHLDVYKRQLQLCGIDGIPAVMARTVRYKFDQALRLIKGL